MARRLFHFGASNQEESSRNNRTSVKSSKQALVVYASKSWWVNRLTGSRQDEASDGITSVWRCILHPPLRDANDGPPSPGAEAGPQSGSLAVPPGQRPQQV